MNGGRVDDRWESRWSMAESSGQLSLPQDSQSLHVLSQIPVQTGAWHPYGMSSTVRGSSSSPCVTKQSPPVPATERQAGVNETTEEHFKLRLVSIKHRNPMVPTESQKPAFEVLSPSVGLADNPRPRCTTNR